MHKLRPATQTLERSSSQNSINSQGNSETEEQIVVETANGGDQSQNNLPPAQLQNENPQNNNNQNEIMALSPGDILRGIPDFDHKSQDNVKKFIAQVDLMYLLAPNSNDTILAITRAKLIIANKLNSVGDKTWAQIKADIKLKYRTLITFEVAQEKLLSLQQGPKEALDAYANRVRSLLESLNGTTNNENADIQNSNRAMNESLAIRKFKQNLFDRELRGMALSAEHENLSDAISHASSKHEQLIASNLHKMEIEKKEPEGEKQQSKNIQNPFSKQSNFKKNREYTNKNKNNSSQCTHCKKTNHQSDKCFFRPGGPGANKSNENETKSSNVAAAVAQPSSQPEAIATTSSAPTVQSNTISLQPYHYLNC